MRRQGFIEEWNDREIRAGTDWALTINVRLNTASMILLLISSDFLASDYCYSIEMQRALERHDEGEACVIPIILRPVDWKGAPFANLQCLPREAKPITLWKDQDEAFFDVAQDIRLIVDNRCHPNYPGELGDHMIPDYHLALIELNNYRISLREAIEGLEQGT